jgi:integrase/recombinase XerD
MKYIKIDLATINGETRIRLFFQYDREIIGLVKTIPGARWNPDLYCWHISTSYGPAEKLNYRFKDQIKFLPRFNVIKPRKSVPVHQNKSDVPVPVNFENKILEEYYKTLRIRNYSPKTIKTYTSLFRLFMKYYQGHVIDNISGEEIREYLLYLIEKRKVSRSHENQSINSIKFYYEKILGREPETYYIQRPKNERKLPIVLSEEEVVEILHNVHNLKHKCILYLIYSAGLRLGEVINLKLTDIDPKRKMITIRHGKGAKDRYTLLSDRLLPMLREYYREFRPKVWLFEGRENGQYSERSIQEILKNALRKTKIRKKVTIHTLRHSFATHLLEHGIDLTYIQDFLGHTNIKTTLIYTHITQKGIDNIKSPLDNLDI